MITLYLSEVHIARKNWICDICKRKIKQGEKYGRERNWNGTVPYCSNCYTVKFF